MPAIQRTDGEKIRLASTFLANRGYFVVSKLLDKHAVAEMLGISLRTLDTLSASDEARFPKPYDITPTILAYKYKAHRNKRWRLEEVEKWLETRRVAE